MISRTLPAGVRLFYYVVLNDRVVLWVAGDEESRRFDLQVTGTELQHTVEAARNAIARRAEGDTNTHLERLFAMLVEPAVPWMSTARALVVAPDGVLQRVPFAALRDPSRRRYLVERVPVVIVPGASLLVSPAHAGRERSVGSPELLVLGNPALADGSVRGLEPLAGAEDEALELARVYDRSRAATGAAATRSAFLDGMESADVVHVAAHALVNSHRPALSRLLFAPDVDAGAVTADDVRALSIARPRLLVLAACATADGPIARGEGALGLARAFLAAGLPAVVATQWAIEDRASRRLFVEFHRRWRAGRSVADALRDAQLLMIAGGNREFADPVSWAPVMALVRTVEAGLGATPSTRTKGAPPP
jgi:CHAT domain-containing protein